MAFKKGHPNLFFHHSEETKKKISENNARWNLGKHMSEESKKKMRTAKLKNPSRYWLGKSLSKEIKAKISKTLKGRNTSSMTEDGLNRLRESKKGDKNPNWRGGITTPERQRFLSLRYLARKVSAEGSHTQGEWELLKKQYGYCCPSCGRCEPEIKLTEDHIIPLSKGGSDYIENIQPLCKSCNCKKSTKIISFIT